MREFLIEFKLVILFFVLLTALTGVTQIENHPQMDISLNHENSIQKISYVKPTIVRRTPAAVSLNSETILTKSFFCKDNQPQPPTQVSKNLVMLAFKLCQNTKLIQSVSLMNETNGFKAQIFKPELNSYKTDYIQLNDGSNNISVEVILKDGQINRESLVILTGS